MNNQPPRYQDNAEDFLEEFFDQPESQKTSEIAKILANSPSWPILYHLSPQRRMILEWYDFRPNSRVLEIGAGCGAITNTFLKKCHHVTCLELEEKRAKIITKRYADYHNLKVLSGDLATFTPNQRYDYISLIGVLEYAGKLFNYPNTKDYSYQPFIDMLKKTRQLLSPSGQVFIAIENKLGLKYLTGCLEDHYSIEYESIEDYPHYNGIRTFSKYEIKKILKLSGFTKIKILYPFPDYKLPLHIFSRKSLHQQSASLLSSLPTPSLASPRQHPINEVMAAKTFLDAHLLDQFSNSFLIVASL